MRALEFRVGGFGFSLRLWVDHHQSVQARRLVVGLNALQITVDHLPAGHAMFANRLLGCRDGGFCELEAAPCLRRIGGTGRNGDYQGRGQAAGYCLHDGFPGYASNEREAKISPPLFGPGYLTVAAATLHTASS